MSSQPVQKRSRTSANTNSGSKASRQAVSSSQSNHPIDNSTPRPATAGRNSRDQSNAYVSEGDGDDTLDSGSSRDIEEDEPDTVIVPDIKAIQTRASNGITKKRYLPDAASLSEDDDDHPPVSISPTKKTRVGISAAAAHAVSDEHVSDAMTALSMSPLKIDRTSTSKASSTKSSIGFTDPFIVESPHLLSPATITSVNSVAGNTTSNDTFSVPVDHADGEVLHPKERSKQALTILRSKPESEDNHNNSKVTSTPITPKARRKFKDVHPPSLSTAMMSNGPVLLEDIDNSNYAVTELPLVCEVTKHALQDHALVADYNNLPKLRSGCLYSWSSLSTSTSTSMILVGFSEWASQCPNLDYDTACSAVRFVCHKNFINPSRISPLDVNIHYTSDDRKKSILKCNFKTAICLSPIYVVDSSILTPSTSGLRNKFLAGYLHKQEWQRFEGFACMVFNRPSMKAQIRDGALQFVTMGSYTRDRDSASPSKGPRNPNILSAAAPRYPNILSAAMPSTPKSKPLSSFSNTFFKSVLDFTDDIPVFDSRSHDFNFASDLENISDVLPLYHGEIPTGSFVVVRYSLGHYDTMKDGVSQANLTTNILFAILIAID